MGRPPIQVNDTTLEQIRAMAMDGKSRRQISSKTGLTEGVIKWQMDKHGIPLQSSRLGIKKQKKKETEMGDYSNLGDDVLFDHKKFTSI